MAVLSQGLKELHVLLLAPLDSASPLWDEAWPGWLEDERPRGAWKSQPS